MNDNINTRPAQEPEINEADGEPIFEFEDAAPENVDPETGEIKEDSDDDE